MFLANSYTLNKNFESNKKKFGYIFVSFICYVSFVSKCLAIFWLSSSATIISEQLICNIYHEDEALNMRYNILNGRDYVSEFENIKLY